jgi:integrase
MGVYLRGRYYWYKRMIDGVCYYRSLKIKKGQETMLSARMAQVDEEIAAEHFGLPSPSSSGRLTLAEFIPVYSKRKIGKGSLDRDLQRLNLALELMGNKRLMAYGKDDTQELEKKLLEMKRAPATVNRYMQVLHHLFDIAIQEKAVRTNPLAGFEYFPEDQEGGRALSDEEIKQLLSDLRAIRDSARAGEYVKRGLYDMARIGLLTGARLSELIFLRHDQLAGDIASLRVSQTKFRKRGRRAVSKTKEIYFPPQALTIVGAQPKTEDGFVFDLRRRDGRVITKAIHTLRGQKKITVPKFTFHCLRHTFVTRANEVGDLATVQGLVGHSDYRTTQVYTHPRAVEKRKVVAILGTRFSDLDVTN